MRRPEIEFRRSLRAIAVLLAATLVYSSCNSDDNAKDDSLPLPRDELAVLRGVVLDTNGEPRSGVAVIASAAIDATTTGADGAFEVLVARAEPRIRIGDDVDAAFIVRVDIAGDGADAGLPVLPVAGVGSAKIAAARRSKVESPDAFEIGRPVFLEPGDGAFIASLPAGVHSLTQRVDDPELEGFALTIESGTDVSYPPPVAIDKKSPSPLAEEIALLALAPDRLALPFPGGCCARIATHIGPLGLRFSPAAKLSLPNVDGLPPGAELDFAHLDPGTGRWEITGRMRVDVDGVSLVGGRVRQGGIYAPLSRAQLPRTNVRARILGAATEPVAGYRVVVTSGAYSGVSDEDGFVEIDDVPVRPDAPIRLLACPPPRFRHELVISTALLPNVEPPLIFVDGAVEEDLDGAPSTDFGNVRVGAVIRAGFPPIVSYSPGAGATGVGEFPRIRVRFDRPMDLDSLGIQVVRGIAREQIGIRGTTFLRFVGESVEIEFIPVNPLQQNGTFYTVFVPRGARDLDGNVVDVESASSRFHVRDLGGNLPDDDDFNLEVHAAVPNSGIAGDFVEVLGRNLNTEGVRFGATEAFPDAFDDEDRSFLSVRVPLEIAGEVVIQVKNIEGKFLGDLPFRATPFVEQIFGNVATRDDDGAFSVFLTAAHLGSAPRIVWNGIAGGSIESLAEAGLGVLAGSDGTCPIELPARRECFQLTLSSNAGAGSVYVEVGGFRSRRFFVADRLEIDDVAPSVMSTSADADAGASVAADARIAVIFSELLDRTSVIEVRRVTGAGNVIGSARQSLIDRRGDDGAAWSEIVLSPPGAGWPAAGVRVVASTGVLDLGGNELDQDADTTDREDFVLDIAVTP